MLVVGRSSNFSVTIDVTLGGACAHDVTRIDEGFCGCKAL